MKNIERDKARSLRKEQGLSIKQIAKILNVAKSSVSVWVRDIVLDDNQLNALKTKKPGAQMGADAVKNKHKILRKQYQIEGRKKVKSNDLLFIAGCMLYWGEGSKSKNILSLSNSDSNLIIFFIKFLKDSLLVSEKDIAITINCYTDLHSVEEIEQYWLNTLNLPKSSLRKSTVNNISPYSKKKRCGKLEYGTCKISVYNTEKVNYIYGGIQEYAKFCNKDWDF